jgi:hypothetical protein
LTYTKPYLSRSAIINSLSSSTPTPTPSIRSSSSQSSDCSSSLYTRSSSPNIEKFNNLKKPKNINRKQNDKHIDLEENELKTKFYKLKQNSNHSSSFSYGHKNREKLLKKYPSCDYHYYYEPKNMIASSNKHQRQRQASFRKENGPNFFYFSQDPSLSYENYLLNYNGMSNNPEINTEQVAKVNTTLTKDQAAHYHRHHHLSVPHRNQNINKKISNVDTNNFKSQRTNYESYLKNINQSPKLFETPKTTANFYANKFPANAYANKTLRNTEFIPSINSSLPPLAPNLKPSNFNKSSLKTQQVENFVDSKGSTSANIRKEVKFLSKFPTSTIEYSVPDSILSEEENLLTVKNNQDRATDWAPSKSTHVECGDKQQKVKFEYYQPITKYVLENEADMPNSKLNDNDEEDAQYMLKMRQLKRTTSV